MGVQIAGQTAIPGNAKGSDTAGGGGGGSDEHGSDTRLHGRRLLVARMAWLAIVGLTIFLYLLSLPISFAQSQTVCATPPCDPSQLTTALVQELQHEGLSPTFLAVYYTATNLVFELVFLGVALVIFWRKSDDWMAMLVALMLVTFSIATFSASLNNIGANYPALNPVAGLISQIGTASLFLFFYLFPDGRFVPRWTRWLLLLTFAMGVLGAIFPDSLFGENGPGVLIGLGSIIFVQVYRYWRVSGTEERQQTKWVVFGTAVAFGGFGVLILLFSLIGANPEGGRAPSVFVAMLSNASFRIFLALIPISLMIAILRYRLWEIDLLINRTLVYVPLTAIIAGIFAASITLSQRLFVAITGQTSDAAVVFTTLVVVAVFEPLKSGLQHLVDRRFKKTADPVQELEKFSERVQSIVEVMDAQKLARQLVAKAAGAFNADGGAILLPRDGQTSTVYTVGKWNGEAKLRVTLASEGIVVGELALGARRGGAQYGPRDRERLERMVEPVAHALALDRRQDGVKA